MGDPHTRMPHQNTKAGRLWVTSSCIDIVIKETTKGNKASDLGPQQTSNRQ